MVLQMSSCTICLLSLYVCVCVCFTSQAVLSNQTLVVFEVVLSIHRLVRAYSQDLNLLEWESIYDTMAAIQTHLCLLKEMAGANHDSPRNTLVQCLKDLFMTIEECYAGGQGISIGEPEKFFNLVEESIDTLPVRESSCMTGHAHYN